MKLDITMSGMTQEKCDLHGLPFLSGISDRSRLGLDDGVTCASALVGHSSCVLRS